MQKQATVQIPQEVQVELTNLRGFRDLVGERMGYMLGRRVKQAEMNEATEKERKKVREINKDIKDNIEKFIEKSDIKTYKARLEDLKEARKVVTTKTKPFREKISPLSKAVKYMDNIAIPDALKELGTPVQPRFTLSAFIKQQLEAQKKN